jgi:hypothetical protein
LLDVERFACRDPSGSIDQQNTIDDFRRREGVRDGASEISRADDGNRGHDR